MQHAPSFLTIERDRHNYEKDNGLDHGRGHVPYRNLLRQHGFLHCFYAGSTAAGTVESSSVEGAFNLG